MSESRPIGGKIMTKPFQILLAITIISGVIVIKRFIYGIGSVTNLSDGYPWGIWIAYDVVVGTALACGGYAMALLVYIFNKGKYHPLVRPALLTSMFGYTLAAVSLLIDIGRYWQAYNLFVPWLSHVDSVMFEVALCITLYIFVLWIEFSPAFFEKFVPGGWKGLNRMMFIFIALGVLLPTMHQSSLGTLLVIAGHKVSPLWQTGFLPMLFLISAIAMGYSVVVLESILTSVSYKRPLETPILSRLTALIPWLLIVYLVVRFGDIMMRGQLSLVFAGDLNGLMFAVENILYIVPVVILLSRSGREKPRWLFVSSVSMLLAGSVYRFNAFLVGFSPDPGWQYFPSFSELMITLGIISMEIMLYMVFIRKLPVLQKLEHA
jgi:Ni/Fe-hydrogenase subunit HybB-like protein